MKKKSYELVSKDGESGIKCLICGLTSYHPDDIKNPYCGNCRLFHDRQDLKAEDIPETMVQVVLDESGSMEMQRDEAIKSMNEYFESLRKEKFADKISFSLFKFNTEFKPLCENVRLRGLVPLSRETYAPDGYTALYDAFGHAINLADKAMRGKENCRTLIAVLTDGQENASKEFKFNTVADLIKEKSDTGKWTFVYLGAVADAWIVGQGLGIPSGNVVNMSFASYSGTVCALAASTSNYMNDKSTSATNFASSQAHRYRDAGAAVSTLPDPRFTTTDQK